MLSTTWERLDGQQRADVAALSRRRPGRWLPELGFTIGGVAELVDPAVRLALAVGPDDRVQAVTSWLPTSSQGALLGLTLDVMRRSATAPNGLVEVLIAEVLADAARSDLDFVSLSVAPLAEGSGRLATVLAPGVEPLYGCRSLAAFKDKFGPEYRPLVLAVPHVAQLPAVALAVGRAYLPVRPRPRIGGAPGPARPGAGATLPAC